MPKSIFVIKEYMDNYDISEIEYFDKKEIALHFAKIFISRERSNYDLCEPYENSRGFVVAKWIRNKNNTYEIVIKEIKICENFDENCWGIKDQ